MKKRKQALFAICMLAAVLGGSAFYFRDAPPGIPPFDEALFFKDLGKPDPEAFAISKEDLDRLRQILECARKDRDPMKWVVSGILVLSNHGEQVSTMDIYINPNGPGPFRMLDGYYLGYDQESFQEILGRSKPVDLP